MTVVEKINLNEIEDFLKVVSEEATQIKILQDELRDINENLDSNKNDFSSGKISKEMYKDTEKSLLKQKKILTNKINKIIENILLLLEELASFLSKNKI